MAVPEGEAMYVRPPHDEMPADGSSTATLNLVSRMRIFYARGSTIEQHPTAQRYALMAHGVDEQHIYVDHRSACTPERARMIRR